MGNSVLVLPIEAIVSDPNIRGGRPIIVGTGITVMDIATAKVFHGQEADGIAEWYELTLSQVYAALAYYYDHKAEIDSSIRDRRARADILKEQILARQPPSLLP